MVAELAGLHDASSASGAQATDASLAELAQADGVQFILATFTTLLG